MMFMVRRFVLLVLLGVITCHCAFADSPFPDNKKNHWVYVGMAQIKKNHLWYRIRDKLPLRTVSTRSDIATRTLLLALDSQNLIDRLQTTTRIISEPAKDAETKKWANGFIASFDRKKLIYQNYLRQITRLWKYFFPEIKQVAKGFKIDPLVVQQNLKLEKITLDGLRIRKRP